MHLVFIVGNYIEVFMFKGSIIISVDFKADIHAAEIQIFFGNLCSEDIVSVCPFNSLFDMWCNINSYMFPFVTCQNNAVLWNK